MIMVYFWVCCEHDGFRHALDSLQFHCIVSESRKMTLLFRLSVVMHASIPVIGGMCETTLMVADHSGRDNIHNMWLCFSVSYAITA